MTIPDAFAVDDLVPGDGVCLAGSTALGSLVEKALPTVLAAIGKPYAIVKTAALKGTKVALYRDGENVPSSITGLAAQAGFVRMSAAARCEYVSAYSTGDYPLGSTDGTGQIAPLTPRAALAALSGNLDTRASVQAVHAPANTLTILCAEVSAPYKFDATDLAAGDGVTRLKANDATPGTWVAKGDVICAPLPLGGTSDDAPNLSAFYNACAGKYAVAIRPGTYLWKSAHQLPAKDLLVIGARGVEIQNFLAADGQELNAQFNYVAAATLITTLQSASVEGSPTITCVSSTDASLAVGNFIQLSISGGSPLRLATYQIKANNTGTGVLTLDRPVVKPFPSGSPVASTVPCQNLRIVGNGMRLTTDPAAGLSPRADRAVEIVNGWGCHISGLEISGSFQDFVCGYDLSSYDCAFEDITVDCKGVGFACFTVESAERITLRRCRGRGSNGQAGIHVWGSYNINVDDCHITGCSANGMNITEVSSSVGCRSVRVRSSTFTKNTGHGIAIDTGASDCEFDAVDTDYNGGSGIKVTLGSGPAPQSLQFRGLRTRGNSVYGATVDSASLDVHFHELLCVNNVTGDIFVQGGAIVYVIGGLVKDEGIVGAFVPLVLASGTGTELHFADLHVWGSGSQNFNSVQADTGSKFYARGCTFERGAAQGVAIQTSNGAGSGSEAHLHGIRVIGNAISLLIGLTADKVILGPDCDLSGGTTTLNFNGNNGTLIVSQAGPVSKAITSADVTLTFLEAQSSYVETTGAPTAARNLIYPTVKGMRWSVFDNSSGANFVTHKTAAGTGVAAGAHQKHFDILCDGTNIVRVTPDT